MRHNIFLYILIIGVIILLLYALIYIATNGDVATGASEIKIVMFTTVESP